MFLTSVKCHINARIHRNSNRTFILYDDRIVVEFGFVRIILAISPRGLVSSPPFGTADLACPMGFVLRAWNTSGIRMVNIAGGCRWEIRSKFPTTVFDRQKMRGSDRIS